MKLNKFFMGLLGALALTACSNEDVAPVNPLPDEGESRYMSVSIRNSQSGFSRAGGDQAIEDGKNFEEGYSDENKVKSLRFYFFKDDGSAAPVKFNGESYYDCEEDKIESDGTPSSPNVESILKAVIVINANTKEGSRNDIKQMVAVVNYDKIKEKLAIGNGNLSLSQLEAIIATEEEAGNKTDGFLMTSSAFYAESHGLAVEIKDTDIKATKELAEQFPVDVYVERAVAKVRVTTKWDPDKMTTTSVTFENKQYTAVELKDQNGNPIRVGNDNNSDQAYVIFQNWDLWWKTDKTNLFKKIDNWESTLGNWRWNDPTFHRSYWAENPEDVKLSKEDHTYPSRLIGKTDEEGNYAPYTAYCLENAADFGNNGMKKSYDPDVETTNRTLVYLSAKIVTVKDGVATPVDLAEWAGYKYTKAGVLTAMFAPNVNQFYFLHMEDVTNPPTTDDKGNVTESGSSNYNWIPLQTSDLELVTGMMAGIAGDDKENDSRYLSFVNLIPEEKGLWNNKTLNGQELNIDKQLYQKVGEGTYKPVDIDYVNSFLVSVGGAKVWDDGNSYYYYELTHLGKTGEDASGKTFTYGVVRNHIYEVELNSVIGLGTPVLTYKDEKGSEIWEKITPQKPTPDSYFLGARLNILSWRVVNNSVNLEW